jgi:hypothetical protein
MQHASNGIFELGQIRRLGQKRVCRPGMKISLIPLVLNDEYFLSHLRLPLYDFATIRPEIAAITGRIFKDLR